MKGLAEFVMRGRLHALATVVLGAGSMLLCWISAAVLALVALRKGVQEAAWILLWALLPAGAVMFVYGDSSPLALLVGSMVLALVLRGTVSLAITVLASAGVALVSGLLMVVFAGDFLAQLAAGLSEFIAGLEAQLAATGGEAVAMGQPSAVWLAGMLGAGNGMLAMLCVLLARYWQAALYNPGGFGEEFRALRYPPSMSMGLVLGSIAVAALGTQYGTWAVVFMVPLSFAGLALVHARAASRGWGTTGMSVFYLAWVVVDPVKLIVVFAAIADSWFDFRQRWAAGSAGKSVAKKGDRDDPPEQD
ncbi:MAG: hypothetical protein AAGI11_07115 [Pseudomonadota bacterium]